MLRWTLTTTLTLHLALITALLLTAHGSLGLGAALLLFAPLPGLLKARAATAGWASMLLVFYCALPLAAGWMDAADRVRDFSLAALAVADFVALMLLVKVLKSSARKAT